MNLNLGFLLPEWITFGVIALLLITEILTAKSDSEQNSFIAPTALIGTLIIVLSVFPYAGKLGFSFNGMFILDPFASFFKAFFALITFAVLYMSKEFFKGRTEQSGELYLIALCTLLGFFILVSANDFILLFVALEIITLSFYIMTAYLKKNLASIEAGLKYLILGSLASAFMIYGISLIYIAAGSTSFPVVRDFAIQNSGNGLILSGMLMMLAAVGFKVAAVPFQFWVPDVYEGAPTPVVSFLSVGSKAAGFVILLRVFFMVFGEWDDKFACLLAILAAITLLYGNLGALVQTNIKRLMGYSSIGHAGYLLIGIASGKSMGAISVMYYLVAYAISTLAVFFLITLIGKALDSDNLKDYKGLAKRSPFLAGSLFLGLLSLAGIPPLAGFFGKFLVLLAGVQSGISWLVLLGALGVAVSLFYYLSVVRIMYFAEAQNTAKIEISRLNKVILIGFSTLIILVGVWQKPFFTFAETAARYLF